MPTFEVTAVLPTERLTPTQQLEPIITATVVTIPHGVIFEVTVPNAPGWKEALAREAAAQAAEYESAFDLG